MAHQQAIDQSSAITKEDSLPKAIVIDANRKHSILEDIIEIWQYHELFVTLAMRDMRVRYKQSILGLFWVIIQPIVACLVFTFVFGHLIGVSSEGIPYPVFVFSGLLLWQFFNRNLTEGVGSLVINSAFINKIYFPRIGIPLTCVLSSTLDFILAFFVLIILMLGFGVNFHWQILYVPFIILASLMLSYSGALIFAPLNAIYRDVGLMIGYGMQFLMYLSPVIYPVSFIPQKYQWLYAFNPIATLINGMRWAIIGTPPPSLIAIIVFVVITFACFITGRFIFQMLEPTIVDKI